MNIQELTQHPERLNRETLYELRRLTALYPFYQPARVLLIKNLYLLHDSSFDEEMQRAAIYLSNRELLFNIVEAEHHSLQAVASSQSVNNTSSTDTALKNNAEANTHDIASDDKKPSRTSTLIDSYLNNLEDENENAESTESTASSMSDTPLPQRRRKPTAADATVDYVAYLMQTDFADIDDEASYDETAAPASPHQESKDALIDAFIDGGRITLKDEVEYVPEMPLADNSDHTPDDSILTETLAAIYIKQQRYEKALDIMCRINNTSQKKNKYFDDQKRFLEKLITAQRRKS